MGKPLPSTMVGIRRLIAASDSALDRSNEAKLTEALAHTNASGQINGLPLLEGRQPVVWLVRPLSVRDYRGLTRTSAHELQKAITEDRLRSVIVERATFAECCDAFALGVVGVENATGADGKPIDLEFDDAPGGKSRVLKPECVDELFARFKADTINDIGRQVIEACELPPR